MTDAAALPPPVLRFRLDGRETAQRLAGGKAATLWSATTEGVHYEIDPARPLFLVAHDPIPLAEGEEVVGNGRTLTLAEITVDGEAEEPLVGKLSFYDTRGETLVEHRIAIDARAVPKQLTVPSGARTLMVRVRLAGRGRLASVDMEARLSESAAADGEVAGTGTPVVTDGAAGRIERLAWRDFEAEATGWIADPGAESRPLAIELWIDGQVAAQAQLAETVSAQDAEGRPIRILPFALRGAAGPRDLAERTEVRITTLGLRLTTPAVAPPPPAEAEAPLAPATPADGIAGSVNTVSRIALRGWVANDVPGAADPDLVLAIDGTPFSFACPRIKAADAPGNPAYHGFAFELPSNLGILDPVEAVIAPIIGVSRIEKAQVTIPPRIATAERATLPIPAPPPLPTRQPEGSTVSFVLLNLNGADLLRGLLDSAFRFERGPSVEWIVVDHASTDGSQAVCAEMAARGLAVRLLPRPANFSFSESSNVGAAAAQGDILVFINNDIVLTQSLSGEIAAALADPEIGLVGIKLFDAPPPDWAGAAPIQHLGVHLDPLLEGVGFRPFEARPVPEIAATMNRATSVPAVTGALCAIRRVDFARIGGFDEGYHYGYEDVDLALKVGLGLGLRALCLNGSSAIHRRGHTRSEGTRADPRRARNAIHFNRRWGTELRRAVRRDVLERPGLWNGHRPVLAFALATGLDEAAARAAGRALQAVCPVHVAYLDEVAAHDLGAVDILVTGAGGYDWTRAEAVRPHLVTLAWGEGMTDPGALARAIAEAARPIRVSIKSAAPAGLPGRHWGDTHFAESLADALTGLGYQVRIDPREQWDAPIAATDDVVIALRGRFAYEPKPHQKNILWLISHPEDVPPAEMEGYDHVFVASTPYAELLAQTVPVPVECLHQCTDPRRFHPDADPAGMPAAELLFVGNSRGSFRDPVRWAIEADRPLTVYGNGWAGLVPPARLHGGFVPNAMLGRLYAASGAVLCDHWPDMRRLGFVSNRVFDVLASGTRLIVDDVAGLAELIGDAAHVYRDRADYLARLDEPARDPARTRETALRILAEHSFEVRAGVITTRIEALLARTAFR